MTTLYLIGLTLTIGGAFVGPLIGCIVPLSYKRWAFRFYSTAILGGCLLFMDAYIQAHKPTADQLYGCSGYGECQ